VDEADETWTTMREEGRRVDWEQATTSSRNGDWGRALLAQIRNNNQQQNSSYSGSIQNKIKTYFSSSSFPSSHPIQQPERDARGIQTG